MVRVPVSRRTLKDSKFATCFLKVRTFAPVFAAALIGSILSVAAWFGVADWEEWQAKQEFTKVASEHAQSLQTGVNEYINKLTALRAFFDASSNGVTRNEFQDFVQELLNGQNVIQGFSWVPRIRHADRQTHELAGVRDGISGYHIKTVSADGQMEPAPEAEEYFPIFYSNEPLTAIFYGLNELDAGGFRQQTIDRARDSNHPATTRSFPLQLGVGDRIGFFVALPVYQRGVPHDTIIERRRNLVGFVQGTFQFNGMVDTILGGATSQLNVLLFDGDAGPDDLPVHVASARAKDYLHISKFQAASLPANWVGALTTGDKRWALVVTPAIGPSSLALHSRAWIVLCAGLVICSLVVAYILNSIRQYRRLEAANNTVFELARTDALTGVANRRAFVERLTESFGSVARGNAPFAVQFIDLDGFKDINDTQGHSTGDALLVQVATRLTSIVRVNDLVARFGGDEFAVLQSDVSEPAAAGALAAKILKSLAAHYTIDGAELHITASVGIALHSICSDGPKVIMMQADLALYRAKDDGGDSFRFHSGELDQQFNLRVRLAGELRSAIDHGQFELHYQTQVEIRSGVIVGLEALVRWNHPTLGVILPLIFVPIAERTGGIAALGQWVLARACRQLKEWEDQGIAAPRLAINVSGAQLKTPVDFELAAAECFTTWGIRPHAIEFELTETILMEVTQKHTETLERLKQLGATLAIDDFGTGYSSLKNLAASPVHRLKIAQELIAGVTADARSAVVVRATIRLAHELGIEVIAEGVENTEQAHFLLDAGCEYAQGYYYARPANAHQVSQLLSRARTMPLPEPGGREKLSAA